MVVVVVVATVTLHTCTMVLNCTVYRRRPAVKRTLLSPARQAESMVLLLDAL